MLSVAIAGLGGWGRHLVESVQGVSGKLRFTHAFAPEADRTDAFVEKHGLQLAPDLDAMLCEPAITAVVLATPHSLHREHVERAAAAGKHVFVEKPLALNSLDAEAAVRACRDAGVGLFVGFNWRFEPALRALAAIVRDGTLGEILHVEGNYSGPSGYSRAKGSWRTEARENPAGAMTGRGVHVLNAMHLICGPVAAVVSFNDRRAPGSGLEDTTSSLLRFANGASGYVGSSQVTAEFWRLHVLGSKGWAEMRMETELRVALIGEAPTLRRFDKTPPERPELEAFADCVTSNTFSQEAIRDAVGCVAVLEAIDASAKSGVFTAVRASPWP